MVEELLPENEIEFAAMKMVATNLGISPKVIHRWKGQSEVNLALLPGLSSQEHDAFRRLMREHAELRKGEQDLEKRVSVFCSRTRPPHDEMISFNDFLKDRFGLERICVAIGAAEGGFITAGGYRAAKRRSASARSVRDELLIGEVGRIHESNYSVYRIQKTLAVMRRARWEVGWDQVSRLMRNASLRVMTRRKTVHTRVQSKLDVEFPDLF